MFLKTPPMGWNTWNTFGKNIDEKLILETADAMIANGLKDAGYEYLVIDDCWSNKQRDANGNLMTDPVRFPHGLKYLADYIHSKGLKFGIYSCCGPLTCEAYPGSLDHEYQDAKFFADNEVDYLKYDWCFHPRNLAGWTLYNRMRMALNATGRNIVFSICNWSEEGSFEWVNKVGGDLFRSGGDIFDGIESIKGIVYRQMPLLCFSGPGCYNDMDMLICGMYGKGNVSHNGGCNDAQYDTHFKLWCMSSTPLMIGCDIRNMDEFTKKLLTNKEYIAINQDPEQRPPMVVKTDSRYIVLFKHLSNGEYALSVSNFTESDVHANVILPEIGFPADGQWVLRLHDIDTGEEIGDIAEGFNINVDPWATRIFKGKVVKVR